MKGCVRIPAYGEQILDNFGLELFEIVHYDDELRALWSPPLGKCKGYGVWLTLFCCIGYVPSLQQFDVVSCQ